ncbi:MAG: PilN domain-containing protein [Halanaerobiales bacterium]
MKVNLLKERNQVYQINWKEIAIVITVSLFIISLGIYYFILFQESSYLQNEVNSLDSQVMSLNIKVAEYNQLKNKVEELEDIEEEMLALKYYWDLALIEKGYIIPANTMINNMEIEDKSISLNGRALTNQAVLTLIDNMELSPIFDEVDLINLSRNDDSQFNIEAILVGEGE